MALQVWLPLTGDLRNNGLKDITVTNNGATVDNSGKIGKCYSFNGSSNYLSETAYTVLPNTFTISLWFYSQASTIQTLVSTRTTAGYGVSLFFINGKLRIDSGIADTSLQWVTTYQYPLNTWTYLTIVRDHDLVSYYVNGVFQDSKTLAYSDARFGNTLTIGACNSNGASLNNYFNGKLNDIRIYDHALSPKEIKEISKGLVCHYKLDNSGVGNPSIFDFSITAKWYADGTTLSMYKDPTYGGVLDVVAESGQTRIYRNVTNIWELNQVYTVSFLARASSTAKCTMSRSLINFTSEFTLTTKWKRYIGTITSSATAAGGTLSFQITTLNVDVYITQIKLEYGNISTPYCPSVDSSQYNMLGYNENIVYDSSGYDNHGSSTNLSVSPNSARNSLATAFNGTSSKIALTSPFVSTVKNPQMSFAFWMNRNNYTDGAARYIYFDYCYIYLHTDYKLRIGWSHATADSKSNNTWACGLLVPATEWHHICFTFSDGVMKVYCDGQLYNTSDRSSTGQFMAVCRTEGTLGVNDASDYFGGSLSDFRIYPTALSAEDVLALYNAPVSVANTGAMMAQGEFVEVIS